MHLVESRLYKHAPERLLSNDSRQGTAKRRSRRKRRTVIWPRPPGRTSSEGLGVQPDLIIYAVDDDEGALRATKWLLESDGLRVEAYRSAKEFLRNYNPSRAGCLLLDFAMPEMNGLQVVRKMASKGWFPPIIVVTGSGDSDPRVRKLANQVFGFVDKPSDPDKLLRLIHQALNDGTGGSGS